MGIDKGDCPKRGGAAGLFNAAAAANRGLAAAAARAVRRLAAAAAVRAAAFAEREEAEGSDVASKEGLAESEACAAKGETEAARTGRAAPDSRRCRFARLPSRVEGEASESSDSSSSPAETALEGRPRRLRPARERLQQGRRKLTYLLINFLSAEMRIDGEGWMARNIKRWRR